MRGVPLWLKRTYTIVVAAIVPVYARRKRLDEMRRLIEAGVTGIATDYPDRLRAIIERCARTPPRRDGRGARIQGTAFESHRNANPR